MKQLTKTRRLVAALTAALVVTGAAASGLLRYPDSFLSDTLYQRSGEPDPRIVVVGIDAYALEELGSWPWDRSVMADVLEELNADPQTRPAVIGVDVIYSGQTAQAADQRLVDAAAGGNIIFASSVDFDTDLVHTADGSSYFSDFLPQNVNLPFPALAEAAPYGHTNAMYDRDGVLRHHLWSVPDGAGGQIPSLPYLLYSAYCARQGTAPDFDPPRSQRGYWWVDFNGAIGDHYAYSAADILYGDYDPDILSDAIVLIGPYDPGLADQYLTAADRSANMFGVEYLANVVDAMLRGAEKTEVPDTPQLALLFGLVFLLAALGAGLPLLRAAALSLFSLCASLAGALGAYAAGLVLHPLWFPMGCAAALVLTVGEHYVLEALERRRITKTFQRYQDPAIIKELLRVGVTDEDLHGKTVEIAVLFVDIRGFTTLSEQLEPTQVVDILDRYLTLTSEAVMKYGGTLDKFVGDCTMAFWGAPLPCEDKAYRACQAAMYMTDHAKTLAEELRQEFGHAVTFGVGIHMGPAVVGNIGSPKRKDYTAIGDTVNTAARLEANAPAGTTYISRTVADALGDRASLTSLGPIPLKGKAGGFEVLRLNDLE